MSPLFYVLWYSGAVVVVLLVWGRTARLRSSYARLAIRLAAVALGFTTVPLFGPDGGAWFPVGLYYLTGGSARFAAWGTATLVDRQRVVPAVLRGARAGGGVVGDTHSTWSGCGVRSAAV